VTANPEFTWSAVRQAAKYRIQLSTTSAFTTITWTADVYGTTATATTELPLGTLHWRVASIDSTGSPGAYSPEQSFTKAQADAPQLLSPANGATLDYPTDPAVLSWNPAAGMKTYRVEIDDEPTFTNPQTYTTQATSFALPTALPSNATRYWRVQGISTDPNVTSAWSDSHDLRTFSIAWPSSTFPSLLTPLDSLTNNVDDMTFSWSTVPGAAQYELQTSTSTDFTSNLTDQVTDAAAFRPTSAMTQDQYYWRVRALEANAEPSGWSPAQRFKREWLDNTGQEARPTVTIADSDLLTLGTQVEADKVLIKWTPVPKASYYELDVSTDPSFLAPASSTSMVHRTCQTPHTEWTPYLSGTYTGSSTFTDTCAWIGTPTSAAATRFILTGGTYYVRVRAVDQTPDGSTRTTVWSNAAREGDLTAPDPVSFAVVASTSTPTSSSAPAQIVSSPDSADTPTLQWQPVNGAVAYLVAMARDSSFNSRITSSGTYFVTTDTYLRLNQVLADNSAGQPYFWFVLPCSSWTDVNTHTCSVGENQAINISGEYGSFNKLGKAVSGLTATPTQTDTVALSWQDQLLTSADGGGIKWYELEVRNAANAVVDDVTTDATGYSPINKTYADGSYTWRVRAIDASGTGLAWSSSSAFQKRSSVPTPLTPAASTTLPALTWSPTPFAASYDLEVYRGVDPSFPAGSRITTARGLRYPAGTLSSALPADTYSWRVRQVDAGGNAGPWSTTIAPFTVGGTKPTLTVPASGASVKTGELVFRWAAVSGAVRYKLESSTTPGFGTLVDNVTTTGTSYAPTVAHTGGTTYYWRVSALDAADDTMATSDPLTFTAVTPPSAPTATATVQGSSIAVAWNAPTTGGSPITSYVVGYRPAGTTTWTELAVAPDVLSTTVGSLPVNTKYEAEVAAVNAAGTGAFSAIVSATTASVPGIPTALKLVPSTHGFAVSWTAPSSTGGLPITGYALRVTPAGGAPASSTATTTSATLSDLAGGTVYTVEVAAVNAAGPGPYASALGTTSGAPAPSGALALAARPTITFGAPAALSGVLKSGAAGVPVVIQSRPTGSATWATLGTATTGGGGAFAFAAHPLVNTGYRAISGSLVSAVVGVGVMPRITVAHRTIHGRAGTIAGVTGRMAPSVAGKALALTCARGGHSVRRASGRTRAGGRFRLSFRLTAGGTQACRVTTRADATHAAGRSAAIAVSAR